MYSLIQAKERLESPEPLITSKVCRVTIERRWDGQRIVAGREMNSRSTANLS
jgi:hypothetical protein